MADVFKFFKNNLRSSYLGVDIGTTSIKVVEVERGGKFPRVINYGFLESGGRRCLWAAGLGLTGMILSKETFGISLAALVPPLAYFYRDKIKPAARAQSREEGAPDQAQSPASAAPAPAAPASAPQTAAAASSPEPKG